MTKCLLASNFGRLYLDRANARDHEILRISENALRFRDQHGEFAEQICEESSVK